MTLPTIQMDDLHKSAILRGLDSARDALEQAWLAVQATAPKAEEFPDDPAAFRHATREHAARTAKVDELVEEIEQLTTAISLL